MRKFLPVFGLMCLLVAAGLGDEANGLLLTAQKTVLDRSKDRDAFGDWARVEKALALKVIATNTSMTDMPEGTITCTIVVRRWGHSPPLYEAYTDTQPFPPLKASAEARLTLGKVKMSGYETTNNRREFQDSIEGWQIVVKHGDVETLKMTSTSEYDKLLGEANEEKK